MLRFSLILLASVKQVHLRPVVAEVFDQRRQGELEYLAELEGRCYRRAYAGEGGKLVHLVLLVLVGERIEYANGNKPGETL